jgi:aminoacyl tRNA synthase complex-interacting multifunctional protein 1
MKSSKFKGELSEAMVLCASTPEKVELLIPPNSSEVGDKISVKGYDGLPVKEINKKNKIFETIKSDLKTNENCIATYKGEPIEVAGKGVVTCLTLKNTQIQ